MAPAAKTTGWMLPSQTSRASSHHRGGSLEGGSCQGAQHPRHPGRRCVRAGSSSGKIKKELLNNHFVFSSAEHSLSGINKQHQSCLDTSNGLSIYLLPGFILSEQPSPGWVQVSAVGPSCAGLCVWHRNKTPRNTQHFSSGSSSLNIN